MSDAEGATRSFLDSSQYSRASILQYELVFGPNFVSPGGLNFAKKLIEQLALPSISRVLDVGCGLGGSAFLMAQKFNLLADGIDLSSNMLTLARERLLACGLEDYVTLNHQDCLTLNLKEYYDAIYSREVFLHIHDKTRLFSVLHEALKPSGKLLFTDYCCGETPLRPDFSRYVDNRRYHLCTISTYGDYLSSVGFKEVRALDMTAQFITFLEMELLTIDSLELDKSCRDELTESWRNKLDYARSGDHRWGLFTGVK